MVAVGTERCEVSFVQATRVYSIDNCAILGECYSGYEANWYPHGTSTSSIVVVARTNSVHTFSGVVWLHVPV